MNYGLSSSLPDFTPFFWMLGIVMAILMGCLLYAEYQESQTVYEMPNGIICESKMMRGGGLMSSGATFHFSKCKDGEKYINPEHYEEIRK